jgi:BON domain
VTLSTCPSPANPRTGASGPKRSESVKQLAGACLTQSGYLALRSISCDLIEGVLHLRGRVPSHYLKQVAQSLVLELKGVRGVVNQIEVVAPAHHAPEHKSRLECNSFVVSQVAYSTFGKAEPHPARRSTRCLS